jgi:KUP system potassium uptake protein
MFMFFSVHRFGTNRVDYTFAPAISVWFVMTAGIRLYSLVSHGIGVLPAFNPTYTVKYFTRNGKDGWVSFGGIVLCVTGNLSDWKMQLPYTFSSRESSAGCDIFTVCGQI